MKKYLFLIFTLCCFAFVGCLKDLDSEGVSQGTVLKGCVVESGSDAAIAGMKVLITNGDRACCLPPTRFIVPPRYIYPILVLD